MRFLVALLFLTVLAGMATAADWRSFVSPDQKTIAVWFIDQNGTERNVVLVDNGSWTLSSAKEELQGEWTKWQERLGDTSTDDFAKKVLDEVRPGEKRLEYAATLYLERLPDKDVRATIEVTSGARAETLLTKRGAKWAPKGVDEVTESFGDLDAFFGKKPGEAWTHIIDKLQPFSSPFYAGAATAPKILVVRKGAPPVVKPPDKSEPEKTPQQASPDSGINWPVISVAAGVVMIAAWFGWGAMKGRKAKPVAGNAVAVESRGDIKPSSSYPVREHSEEPKSVKAEPSPFLESKAEPVLLLEPEEEMPATVGDTDSEAAALLRLVRNKIGMHNREMPGMQLRSGVDERAYVEALFTAAKNLDGYEAKRVAREAQYEAALTDLRGQLHDSNLEKTSADVRATQAEETLKQLQSKVTAAAKPLKNRKRSANNQGEPDHLQQILEAADETERAHPQMELLFKELMSAYPNSPLSRSHDLEQDVKTLYLFQKESLDREAQYSKLFEAVQNACDAIMSRRPRDYAATAVAYLLTYSATTLLAGSSQSSPMLEKAMLMNLSHIAAQADLAVGGDQSLKSLSTLAARLTDELRAGSLEISSQTHRLARSFVDALQMINGTFQLDFSPFHVGAGEDGKIQRIVV